MAPAGAVRRQSTRKENTEISLLATKMKERTLSGEGGGEPARRGREKKGDDNE